MPSFQFYSPEANDAKWLIWGKLLHRKGTRGTKYPEPNVRVQITETAIRVSRDPQTFYYSGTVASPCSTRTISIASFSIVQLFTAIGSSGEPDFMWTFAAPDGSSTYVQGAGSGENPYPAGVSLDLGMKLVRVLLSDGTVLAEVRQIQTVGAYGSDISQITNKLFTSTWNGTGSVGVYDQVTDSSSGISINTYTGSSIAFSIPDDATYTPAAAPTLSPAELAAAFPSWATDWAAAQAVARLRERDRRKTCSDALKANLMAGALQDEVKVVMRDGHLISGGVRQRALMSVSTVNVVTGSGDDVTTTKTVTLSYQSTDSDGAPVTLEQVVTGTVRTVITRCTNSSGTPDAVRYTTATYENYLPVDAFGSTGTALDYTFQLDGTINEDDEATPGEGLCQIWDGVVVTGASSAAATFDSLGEDYSPPYLLSSDSRTVTYPQLYLDYRAATARVYQAFVSSSSWKDSVFMTGEQVDIFPLSVISAEFGDLGVFPQAADLAGTTFRADMKATYSYNYNIGAWTGTGALLADAVDMSRETGGNTVIRSHAVPWPDLRGTGGVDPATYDGQKADMVANPGDYPLFVPLLTV